MTKQLNIDYSTPEKLDSVQKFFKLKKELGEARVKSAIVELAQTTQYLTKKDIAAWRMAWQAAINHENPQRARLYDIYTDILADLHLSGCVNQRTEMVMRKAFRLVTIDKNEEDRQATELLEAAWFKDFMRLALQSKYWGHSLIQFGDILDSNRCVSNNFINI